MQNAFQSTSTLIILTFFVISQLYLNCYAQTYQVLEFVASSSFDGIAFSTNTFQPPYTGSIVGIRLEYISGGVYCNTCCGLPDTHWGCENDEFLVQMIDHNARIVIYPTQNTNGLSVWNPWSCSNGNGCTLRNYRLQPTYDVNDNFIELIDNSNPVTVSDTDVFSLQYSEGCCGDIADNAGITYCNVYFLYTLTPSPTKAPTDNTQYVLADTNICYTDGAKTCSAGNNIIFSAPKSGIIKGIKLVHESGGVGCSGSSVMTNWGCADNDPMTSAYITMLLIKVTNEATYDGLVYYPVNGQTDDINYWNDLSDRSCANQYNTAIPEHYQVGGYKAGSPELILINPIYTVSVNDKFMLGYGESYSECVHQDNPGWSGYASVYFLYESQNCQEEQQIKHINWHQLQNAVDNSAQVPYSSFNIRGRSINHMHAPPLE
eukprot:268210_1